MRFGPRTMANADAFAQALDGDSRIRRDGLCRGSGRVVRTTDYISRSRAECTVCMRLTRTYLRDGRRLFGDHTLRHATPDPNDTRLAEWKEAAAQW